MRRMLETKVQLPSQPPDSIGRISRQPTIPFEGRKKSDPYPRTGPHSIPCFFAIYEPSEFPNDSAHLARELHINQAQNASKL